MESLHRFGGSWSQINGPDTASFENATAVKTKAAFAVPGVYTLRLTAGDGVFSPASDVTVTVTNGIAGWKAQYFTAAELANAAISGDLADPDHDGHNNFQEYIAGTNPRDAQSVKRLDVLRATEGSRLQFRAEAGKSYSLMYRDSLSVGAWLKLADVPSSATPRTIEIPDTPPGVALYYHVATPHLP